MLSTEYRLRLEFICQRIATNQPVELNEMIWANKLAKANRSAYEMLNKARRQAMNPNPSRGGLDDFMIQMGLGDPDPSNHSKGSQNTDEIAEWFHEERSDDWRQHD